MLRRHDAVIADLRGPERLRVSSDGRRVRFSLQSASQIGRGFDLTSRSLGGDDPSLAPPRTEASGLKISDWRDRTDPKLNGKPLQLDPLETSRSVAIAPDAQRFVLGTEWWLRLFDGQGTQVWKRPTPGTTWAVNVTLSVTKDGLLPDRTRVDVGFCVTVWVKAALVLGSKLPSPL